MGLGESLESLGSIAKEQKNAVDLQKRMVESFHLTIGNGNATISTQIARGTHPQAVGEIIKEIKAIFKLL